MYLATRKDYSVNSVQHLFHSCHRAVEIKLDAFVLLASMSYRLHLVRTDHVVMLRVLWLDHFVSGRNWHDRPNDPILSCSCKQMRTISYRYRYRQVA